MFLKNLLLSKKDRRMVNYSVALICIAMLLKLIEIIVVFIYENFDIIFVIIFVGAAVITSTKKQIIGTMDQFITIDDVDLMDPTEFEHYVAALFRKNNYDAYVTKHSGDQGADVIAKSEYGQKIAVQAKHSTSPVGNSGVQEVVASLKYYKCNKGMVVTNNYFTKGAKDLAKVNGVELWDRDKLIIEMSNVVYTGSLSCFLDYVKSYYMKIIGLFYRK